VVFEINGFSILNSDEKRKYLGLKHFNAELEKLNQELYRYKVQYETLKAQTSHTRRLVALRS